MIVKNQTFNSQNFETPIIINEFQKDDESIENQLSLSLTPTTF